MTVFCGLGVAVLWRGVSVLEQHLVHVTYAMPTRRAKIARNLILSLRLPSITRSWTSANIHSSRSQTPTPFQERGLGQPYTATRTIAIPPLLHISATNPLNGAKLCSANRRNAPNGDVAAGSQTRLSFPSAIGEGVLQQRLLINMKHLR